MPIWQSASDLANWSNGRARYVPELGTGTTLYSRIESVQPYRSLAVVTALPVELATVMGLSDLNGVNPLLLQGYSNEDKHHMIRPAPIEIDGSERWALG